MKWMIGTHGDPPDPAARPDDDLGRDDTGRSEWIGSSGSIGRAEAHRGPCECYDPDQSSQIVGALFPPDATTIKFHAEPPARPRARGGVSGNGIGRRGSLIGPARGRSSRRRGLDVPGTISCGWSSRPGEATKARVAASMDIATTEEMKRERGRRGLPPGGLAGAAGADRHDDAGDEPAGRPAGDGPVVRQPDPQADAGGPMDVDQPAGPGIAAVPDHPLEHLDRGDQPLAADRSPADAGGGPAGQPDLRRRAPADRRHRAAALRG